MTAGDATTHPDFGRGRSNSGSEDPRVTRAVEEYLSAERSGRRPDRVEFLARHAEIAARLAECLDGLAFIQGVGPRLRHRAVDQGPSPGNLDTGQIPTDPLGDFRIIREVGRGGMGVVYEAEQLSLGRR